MPDPDQSDREYLDSVIAQSKQRLARIIDLEDVLGRIVDAAAAVLDSYFNDDPDERKKVVVHLERLDDALDSYREATHDEMAGAQGR